MKRKRGSITVFLALILGVMMMLLCACMQSVRIAAARTRVLCAAEIGLYSLFGQFDRELLDEFDLFAVDTGRGGPEPDMACVYDEFRRYACPVLDQNSPPVEYVSGGFTGFRFMTDENGEFFLQQAVKSVQEALESGEISVTAPLLPGPEVRAREEEGRREMASFPSMRETASLLPPTAGTLCTLLNLAGQLAGNGITDFLPEPALLSASGKTARGTMVSGRSLHKGLPVLISSSPVHSGNASDMLVQYELDKLGCCTDPSPAVLHLQVEYVLKGNTSDRENLEEVASDLFAFRLGACLRALLSSGNARSRIHDMVETALETDELTGEEPEADPEELQETALYAWACLEAASDVRVLLSGGKIPLEKSPDAFAVDPERPDPGSSASMSASGEGFSYLDYLSAKMRLLDDQSLRWRGMDMVEWSVRSRGKAGFCLDCCLTAAEISIQVRADGKKDFTLTRAYGYD